LKILAIAIAMSAFFALLANKITSYKLITLFQNRPYACFMAIVENSSSSQIEKLDDLMVFGKHPSSIVFSQ